MGLVTKDKPCKENTLGFSESLPIVCGWEGGQNSGYEDLARTEHTNGKPKKYILSSCLW
jgi:hypothetical protein